MKKKTITILLDEEIIEEMKQERYSYAAIVTVALEQRYKMGIYGNLKKEKKKDEPSRPKTPKELYDEQRFSSQPPEYHKPEPDEDIERLIKNMSSSDDHDYITDLISEVKDRVEQLRLLKLLAEAAEEWGL